ncbi:DMT family transporter [Balneolaceae bacterium ANBcel3]|nr:DMT family transporter [Balneolaceae bacterium ANBcel3]
MLKNLSGKSAAELYLLFIVFVWASNFSVVKYSLEEIDPFSFNAIRFFLATLFMWVVVYIKRLKITVRKKDYGKLFLLAILGNLLYQMLFIIGVDRTFASNAAVMLGLIPVWVALLSHLFTPEKMHRIQAIGVLLAFAGVALISGGGEEGFSLQAETLIGDLIIVVAALVFAAYTLLSRSLLEEYSPLTLSVIVMTIGGSMLILVGIPSIIRLDFSAVSTLSLAGVAYSGIFSIGLAYLIWNFGIKNTGTVRTAMYQNLVPVLGIAIGFIFLGEKLQYLQYIGSLLTIGGIMLSRHT